MKVIIRHAKTKELEAVQDLNFALFQSDNERDSFLNHDWPYTDGKEYFKKRITNPKCICLVAEIGEEIVGYLAGEVLKIESWRPVKRTELQNMFVKPQYRSQGIGRKLVNRFLKWSRSQGVKRALVIAYATNTRAVEFYKKCGFISESLALEANVYESEK